MTISIDEEKGDGGAVFEVRKSSIDGRETDAGRDVLVKEGDMKANGSTSAKMLAWTVLNMVATIGIVFTNKAIFDDPSFRLAQLSFAAFHFFVTGMTLFILSRPQFGMFDPHKGRYRDILPLAFAMCLNVVLPNLSLAFSSVTFYQIARIMLTPTVALLNYVLYGSVLSRGGILSLIPVCVGVGLVTYYDSLPAVGSEVKTTTPAGVMFAFTGVIASSLYTVWIAYYHKKLQMNSMQLLFNQAPLSGFLLLYIIPFTDKFPVWSTVPMDKWMLIGLSGVLAAIINLSQFFIVAGAGPVTSTVVGHLKTCSIVALGWATSGRAIGDKSIFGILIAIAGIVLYSSITFKGKK